ncbi:hypothetical protein Tco_1301295 [Tanacetum coccineum]
MLSIQQGYCTASLKFFDLTFSRNSLKKHHIASVSIGFTLTVPEDDASESNSLVTEFLNDSLPDVVKVCSGPLTQVSGGVVYEGEVMVVAAEASSVRCRRRRNTGVFRVVTSPEAIRPDYKLLISGPAPLCPGAIELGPSPVLGYTEVIPSVSSSNVT